jgi:crotonobetainyl-CoA:carnitine CoA-transferase CaiB-like acyl-CoA transferase
MPLHTVESVVEDPHLAATGFFRMVDHPTEGRIRTMAVPVGWSKTPPELTRQALLLGEYSEIREVGYSDARIAALAAEGAVSAPSLTVTMAPSGAASDSA